MSYPLRNFDQDRSRRRPGSKVARRAVERVDEIEAMARATESQCRSWQWLKSFTALRVGGPVAAIIYPSTVTGAAQLVHQLQQAGIRWRALGHGTSVLATDDVHDFVVISLRLMDERLIFDGSLVTVHAGYSLIALVQAAAERGLSGLEGLAGLPGSVGGALRMETESEGCDLWRLVERVTIAERGALKVIPLKDLVYRDIVYKEGNRGLAEDALILTATLKLSPGSPANIKAETEHQEVARGATAPESNAAADDVVALSDLIREQARKLRGLNLKLGPDVWKNGNERNEK